MVSDEVSRGELWLQPSFYAHDWSEFNLIRLKDLFGYLGSILVATVYFISREGAVDCGRKEHMYLHFAKEIHLTLKLLNGLQKKYT